MSASDRIAALRLILRPRITAAAAVTGVPAPPEIAGGRPLLR
ncbi:hypothetical protein [Nocardia sp. NPDC060249]